MNELSRSLADINVNGNPDLSKLAFPFPNHIIERAKSLNLSQNEDFRFSSWSKYENFDSKKAANHLTN